MTIVREFYPGDIKSKINIYCNGERVKRPIMAVCMSTEPNVEVDGWVETVTVFMDENGNMLRDEYNNPLWLIADSNLEDDWYQENITAKAIGATDFPRPSPDIRRYWGKIKWELAK